MKHILIIALALFSFSNCFAVGKVNKVKKQKTTQVNTDSLALLELRKKAEGGDSNAQNTLGVWYYTGKIVKKDYAKALKWWSVAAKASHAEAIVQKTDDIHPLKTVISVHF